MVQGSSIGGLLQASLLVPLTGLALSGCATSQVDIDPSVGIDSNRPVILLPVVNASGAPLASERTEAILTTLLRRKGVDPLRVYESLQDPDALPELDDRRSFERALVAAREAGMIWGVTGTVVEWRYRPGIDDEPAVSVSLRVVDVADGKVVWSASGARGGPGTTGALAQVLLRELTDAMPLGAR